MNQAETQPDREGPRMMRASELPFEVPAPLAEDIDAFVDAYERGDWRIDMYKEILYQSAGTMYNNERWKLGI